MDVNVVAEWIRVINAITGIIAFTWLAFRASRYWREYSRAERILTAVVGAYVLASIYASAEAYYSHLQFGARTFLTEGADFLLLWALWRTRDNTYEFRKKRP